MQHQHHRAEQGNESTTRPGSRHKNTCGFCSESALSTIYIFSTGFISKRLTEGQLEDENNKVEVELFSF